MGAGEILWWAGATPLTNAGLRRDGNLRLFLNTVSNTAPLTVYWDEYFHGQRASLWSYFDGTPVPWGILQAFVIALAVLFTYSRRSGPIVKPAPVSRLSPLEFVDAVGSLYQSARAGSVAVAVSYRRLRVQLSQRMGFPVVSAGSGAGRSLPLTAWVGRRVRSPIVWRRRLARSIFTGCGPVPPWISSGHWKAIRRNSEFKKRHGKTINYGTFCSVGVARTRRAFQDHRRPARCCGSTPPGSGLRRSCRH